MHYFSHDQEVEEDEEGKNLFDVVFGDAGVKDLAMALSRFHAFVALVTVM